MKKKNWLQYFALGTGEGGEGNVNSQGEENSFNQEGNPWAIEDDGKDLSASLTNDREKEDLENDLKPSRAIERAIPEKDDKNADEMVSILPFEQLIKGEYKEEFQQTVDRIINQRFAKSKQLEEELERYEGYAEVMESLTNRFESKNTKDLLEKINEKWEQENHIFLGEEERVGEVKQIFKSIS